jgi:hypothetical protein
MKSYHVCLISDTDAGGQHDAALPGRSEERGVV